jgi:hypothetical protein
MMGGVVPLKKKARIRRDKANQAVRSYFDPSARKAPTKKKGAKAKGAMATDVATDDVGATTPERADVFLEENRAAFQLQNIELRRDVVKEGAASASVRYEQRHHGLPVYGAQVVIGVPKAGGAPTSAVNKVDYDLPGALTPDRVKVTGEKADEIVRSALRAHFPEVVTGSPRLFAYRVDDQPLTVHPNVSAGEKARIQAVTALGQGKPGHAYLAYRIQADTRDAEGLPSGQWEIMVDAVDGGILTVKDLRRYSASDAFVFWPDPITSSGDAALSWATPASTLDQQRKTVSLANLDPPVNGTYALSGTWVTSVNIEPPAFPPVKTKTDFKFGSKDKAFLSVMAYYWMDRLIVYLRGFGIPTLNAGMNKPIRVDAQGYNGEDQSHFVTTAGGSYYISFGEGGVPDASDPHVIVHEYGHAIHYFLGTTQGGYEEGFNDFMAAVWLDRLNTRQFQRAAVFPWDNNAALNWGPKRRLDLKEKFSDAGFNQYGMYLKGDVLATALWDLFLAVGGSRTAAARQKAADTVVRLYLEMLITAADNSPAADLANGLLVADQALSNGVNKPAIKKAFKDRGLTL